MHTTFVFLASLAMAIANPLPQQDNIPKCSVGTPVCCNGATVPLNLIVDSCIRCTSLPFFSRQSFASFFWFETVDPVFLYIDIATYTCYLDLQLIRFNEQINQTNPSVKYLVRCIAVMALT